MASNLTGQVRNIADVATAIANGDLSRIPVRQMSRLDDRPAAAGDGSLRPQGEMAERSEVF